MVGGAVRDEFLRRPVLDLDIACTEPERAARAFARRSGGAVVPALRAARRLAGRAGGGDGRLHAAPARARRRPRHARLHDQRDRRRPGGRRGGRPVRRPLRPRAPQAARGHRRDLRGRSAPPAAGGAPRGRAGFPARRQDGDARPPPRLARRPALPGSGSSRSCGGSRRPATGGSTSSGCSSRWAAPSTHVSTGSTRPTTGSSRVLGVGLRRLPISNELRRYAAALLRAEPPADGSPRAIHRFRRATEPWALDALAFVGAAGARSPRSRTRAPPSRRSRSLRGDELGLPPGPEIGRMLAEIAEERAAGTITTREEAMAHVRRSAGAVRANG